MIWITSLLSLAGVFLGWGLSEISKTLNNKRADKRKLKKLLYFLLELRHQIRRELQLEAVFIDLINRSKEKYKEDFASFSIEELEEHLPFIKETLSKNYISEHHVEFLEDHIDAVIIELSEVFPVFAYELSGHYKIRDRLRRANQFVSELEAYASPLPFDFKSWLQPKISNQLLGTLDFHLLSIAKMIDRSTRREFKKKLKREDIIDDTEFNSFMDEYVEKIKAGMQQ